MITAVRVIGRPGVDLIGAASAGIRSEGNKTGSVCATGAGTMLQPSGRTWRINIDLQERKLSGYLG
jgi:hypothetical protein